MLKVEVSAPSPEQVGPQTLADLSRNASVISSSSSSSSTSSPPLARPRPIRTFSPPRSRSRDGPPTPRSPKPPAYLARELGLGSYDRPPSQIELNNNAKARSKSRTKSRNSSLGLRMQASDFQFGDILGEGSYSTVMHAVYPPTEEEYAIKVLDKGHLKRNNKLQTALAEKNTLVRLGSGHPGIVRLHWAFHDEWSLYFVLDLARNGELQSRISSLGSLSIECARFYAAQIIDAVAYMHASGVIHRDLKPENLLLDDEMRIKITDFGTGKILEAGVDRANTFVGTAQYVSPELLTTNTTYKSSDLWALGCVIYQMISGKFPFQGLSEYLTWQKIKNLEYSFPDNFDADAKDLVQKLLVLDPSMRLGAGEFGSENDIEALRSHPFFNSINWNTLWVDEVPLMRPGLVQRIPQTSDWNNGGMNWDELMNNENGYPDDESSDGEVELVEDAAKSESSYTYGESGSSSITNQAWNMRDPVDIPPDFQIKTRTQTSNLPFAEQNNNFSTSVVSSESVTVDPERTLDAYTLREVPISEDDLQKRIRADIPAISMNGDGLALDVPDIQQQQDIRASISTGSSTSSSEGSSSIEKIRAALQSISLQSDDDRRGRERTQTPIQHGPTGSMGGEWHTLLHHGERLLFHSDIEEYSRTRRLTITLLPIPVSATKPKLRHLLLTSHRLLCVKPRSGQGLAVKSESFINNDRRQKEKEKDEKKDVMDVMLKGEKGFLVLTGSKTYDFIATDHLLATRWLSEIRAALQLDTTSSEQFSVT